MFPPSPFFFLLENAKGEEKITALNFQGPKKKKKDQGS